jgi:DNA-binding NarL/FixJ family response regulator
MYVKKPKITPTAVLDIVRSVAKEYGLKDEVFQTVEARVEAILQLSLSEDDIRILQLMADGKEQVQIAKILFKAFSTVNNRTQDLRKRMHCKTTCQMIAKAKDLKII